MTKRCAPTHIANGSFVSDVATEHPPALSTSHVSGWLADQCTASRPGGDGYSHQYGAVECVLNIRRAPTHISSGRYSLIDVATENILWFAFHVSG